MRPAEEVAAQAQRLYDQLRSPTEQTHLSALETARAWAQVEALAWVLSAPSLDSAETAQQTLIETPVLRRFGRHDDLVLLGLPALLRFPFQRGPVSLLLPLAQIPALAREHARLTTARATASSAPTTPHPAAPVTAPRLPVAQGEAEAAPSS